MKRVRYAIYATIAAGLVATMFLSRPDNKAARVLARETHADGRSSVDLLSEPYKLDRVYMSMTGPRSNHSRIQLAPGAPTDKTVWLTGVEVDVLDAKDESPISREYFCHSNVTICPESSSPEKHNKSFATPAHANWRFFTLVPGRTSVHLPPGFGVPVKNGTLLDNFTMTLNQNAGHPVRDVQIKTRIWYRLDGSGAAPAPRVVAATLATSSAPAKVDTAASLRPLFRRALYVYQQHAPTATQAAAQSTSASVHQGELCGEACKGNQKGKQLSTFVVTDKKNLDAHPGASCCVENATQDGIMQQFGAENTIHWMVPPGAHRYRTEVSRQMELPFDTTAHYVTGHLHPFGTSLTLVDMETGKSVLAIEGRSFKDRLGVEHISEIASQKGVRLHKGHRYELIAEYENTTQQPIDAMAIMYLYALDVPPAAAADTKQVSR